MPTYQRELLIKRAIHSLLNQTDTEFQVIIVDDGSTDNTEKIVKSIVGNDYRFVYLYQSKSNVSIARNLALEKAEGKWISFLDSDDEFTPDNLMVKNKYLEQHPFADFLISGVKIIGDEWIVDRFDRNKKRHLSTVCPNLGRWWIKKQFLNEMGNFDPKLNFAEDAALLEKITTTLGVWPVFIEEPIYKYYRNGHSQLTKDPEYTLPPHNEDIMIHSFFQSKKM